MGNRNFEDVVRQIASSEEDVDRVLAAARLERREAEPRHLNAQQKMTLLTVLLAILGGSVFLLLFWLPPFIF